MKREQSMFIQRLTQLMEEKDLTQVELAEKTGITNVTISRYLSGERKPRIEIVTKLAEVLNTTVDYLLGSEKSLENSKRVIPVFGIVKAGYNYLAQHNIVGYIDPGLKKSDPENYFGLVVKGDSMVPLFFEGDYLVVHKQEDFNTNDTCIVLINGDEATVKKVVKTKDGIELHAFNPYYEIQKYTFKEITELPVIILGKVEKLIRELN